MFDRRKVHGRPAEHSGPPALKAALLLQMHRPSVRTWRWIIGYIVHQNLTPWAPPGRLLRLGASQRHNHASLQLLMEPSREADMQRYSGDMRGFKSDLLDQTA